ncbi:RelA/SpoT AH/RIS domain-containing protein, partial [Streptococcus pyogenes]
FMTKTALKDAASRFNFTTEDDLYAAVGFGEISVQTVANRLTEKARRLLEQQKTVEDTFEIQKKETKSNKDNQKMKIR